MENSAINNCLKKEIGKYEVCKVRILIVSHNYPSVANKAACRFVHVRSKMYGELHSS